MWKLRNEESAGLCAAGLVGVRLRNDRTFCIPPNRCCISHVHLRLAGRSVGEPPRGQVAMPQLRLGFHAVTARRLTSGCTGREPLRYCLPSSILLRVAVRAGEPQGR